MIATWKIWYVLNSFIVWYNILIKKSDSKERNDLFLNFINPSFNANFIVAKKKKTTTQREYSNNSEKVSTVAVNEEYASSKIDHFLNNGS